MPTIDRKKSLASIARHCNYGHISAKIVDSQVVGDPFHEKQNFWWQNGVEAGIHAKYVNICVVNVKLAAGCRLPIQSATGN